MNQERSSKFVPGLPADDDDNTSTNENIPTASDSTINTFEGVAECTMKDSDNLKSVKVQAKNIAQDNVQKQIAEYIRAFLKDRYLTLPDDETLSIANEISTINDVKYNMRDSDDENVIVRATVTAQLDNKDIMNYLIRFFKERAELKSEIVALRKENEALNRQIEELKRRLYNNQQPNTPQVTLSKQKLIEGWKLHGQKNYVGAIRLYDEAIKINPNNADAYHNRGVAFRALGYIANANEDFAKAKELGW